MPRMPKAKAQKAPAVKATSKTESVEKIGKTAGPVTAPVAASAKSAPVERPSEIGVEERYKMVAEAAYYIALKKGFNSDPAENWAEAEAEIEQQLKKTIRA